MALSKPLNLETLSRFFGNVGADVGKICTANLVNKWSKYKPFRSDKISFLQDSDNTKTDRDTALRNANYGFGYNGTGIIPISSGIYGHNVYSYLKPRGLVNDEPYRIADFISYEANAKIPLVFDWNADEPIYCDREMGFLISNDNPSQSQIHLNVSDIIPSALHSLYVSLLISDRNNASNKCLISSGKTLGDLDDEDVLINIIGRNSAIPSGFIYVPMLESQYKGHTFDIIWVLSNYSQAGVIQTDFGDVYSLEIDSGCDRMQGVLSKFASIEKVVSNGITDTTVWTLAKTESSLDFYKCNGDDSNHDFSSLVKAVGGWPSAYDPTFNYKFVIEPLGSSVLWFYKDSEYTQVEGSIEYTINSHSTTTTDSTVKASISDDTERRKPVVSFYRGASADEKGFKVTLYVVDGNESKQLATFTKTFQ